MVVPGLKAQNRPECSSAIGSPLAFCSTASGLGLLGSCATKLPMSGLEEVNVYAGAMNREQTAPMHVSGIGT